MTDETAEVSREQQAAASRGSQSNPKNVPDEPRFSVPELLENPRRLSTTKRAIAGAFAGVESPKTFTLQEAAERVNAFCNRPEDGEQP